MWSFLFGALTGLIAGMFGLSAFRGESLLAPASLRWLAADDFAQQYFGWVSFRTTPWQLPLGAIRGYADPPGTTLGYVDAFPWFSVLMRVLAERVQGVAEWLGPSGQITGLWLLFCLILQGAIAAWIFHRVARRDWLLIAGGTVLVVLAPVWWRRMQMGHPALCAQWLVIAALALAIPRRSVGGDQAVKGPGTGVLPWIFLQAIAAGIHPYIAVMTGAVGVASFFERGRLRTFFVAGLSLAAVTILVFWIMGYLSTNAVGGGRGGGGFHYFGTDVMAFFNPMGSSGILPSWLGGWSKAGIYEGFAWPGLGVVVGALALASTKFFFRRRDGFRFVWSSPVLVMLLLLAFFSLGSNIRVFGFWLVNPEKPYLLMEPVIETFRSAGRFIWPLYYAVLIQSMILIAEWTRRSGFGAGRRGLVFALVVALNIVDNSVLTSDWTAANASDPVYPHLAALENIETEAAEVIKGASAANLVPAYLGPFSCRGIDEQRFNPDDFAVWRAFGMWAAQHGLASNSGAFARHDHDALKSACLSQRDSLLQGRLDPNVAYVIPPEAGRDAELYLALSARASCLPMDNGGFRFCRARSAVGP